MPNIKPVFIPTFIGSEYLERPDLRELLQFDPELTKNHALVRGIALNLLDRLEEAKKVWVVEECIQYEGCELRGVFSTEQKAEAFIAAKPPDDLLGFHEIKMLTLDEPIDE